MKRFISSVLLSFICAACTMGSEDGSSEGEAGGAKSGALSQQSIVVNGSFEEPQINRAWTVLGTIPGWRTVSGPGIEIQSRSVGWRPLDGTQMVELDSHGPSAMAQDLNTRPGAVYELSVAFSPRPSVVDNRIGVYWNGQQLAVLDASGAGASDTNWQRFTYRVSATSPSTELRFADLSRSDSVGGLIDDVRVISLDSDGDGVPDGEDRCDNTSVPEVPPSEGLGMNRWALIDGDGAFDTRTPNDKEPKRAFTLQDTAGCSCAQIIEKLGLGDGHRKFGCSTGEMEEWIKSLKQ
jgi:hypothetical protein